MLPQPETVSAAAWNVSLAQLVDWRSIGGDDLFRHGRLPSVLPLVEVSPCACSITVTAVSDTDDPRRSLSGGYN